MTVSEQRANPKLAPDWSILDFADPDLLANLDGDQKVVRRDQDHLRERQQRRREEREHRA
ncbi:hypothetical protein SAMN06264364_14514 [Quadrisphaera granulorum]|uniref:Uncharacterized protein n=1 Tax=Quadrisphaera granulorum TaxID=317664 RepID=A0A315ZNM5_9ACTN|nr:hypothetical protein [Quadrisphaera granulorum]PWJ46859.1 hypothetical protein BXY45_14514 [Quadrisphaera granulorum]SZE99026.1 hypothetical protein SAMN06264364_14514 [Quadrisphaera granulorum]